MLRHLVTSACFVVPAAALVVWTARRHATVAKARFFLIGAPTLLVLVAMLSAGSVTYTEPCRDNKVEVCTYNDSVPAIAVVVFVFVVAAMMRAWFLYADR